MKRRSFLASLFASLIAPVLARAATAVMPVTEKPDISENEVVYIEDGHKTRFELANGKYIQVPKFIFYSVAVKDFEGGEMMSRQARLNPRYYRAPFEALVMKSADGGYFVSIEPRHGQA